MSQKPHDETDLDVSGTLLVFHTIRTFKNKIRKIFMTVVNNKQTEVFEATMIDILSTQRLYHYDTQASYYPKLISLVDLQDDIALESDAGVSYRVRDYPQIVFTRKELEEIGSRYTQLKFPELSEEFA